MKSFKNALFLKTSLAVFCLVLTTAGTARAAIRESWWNNASGASAVHDMGYTGAGVALGVVDTGISGAGSAFGYTTLLNKDGTLVADYGYAGFGTGVVVPYPYVDTYNAIASRLLFMNSSCEACGKTFYTGDGRALTDTDGHGTMVAAVMAGNQTSIPASATSNITINQGVAPGASIASYRASLTSSSFINVNVANSIIDAANTGIKVLNISIGPQKVVDAPAFYAAWATAINYAASKKMFIVLAGGNAASPFSNNLALTGLSDDAIRQIIFVGSTSTPAGNPQAAASSFSNIPGSGTFKTTSGKTVAASTRWIMTNGEQLIGPSPNPATGGFIAASWTGTSFAAPQVTGALGLLLQRWPFLGNQVGTAADILLGSTDTLCGGSAYNCGKGFMRIDKAFAAPAPQQLSVPAGTMSQPLAAQASGVGARVSVAASMSASSLASALGGAVAFDKYGRDFPVNLSAFVSSAASQRTISPATLLVMGKTGAAAQQVVDTGGNGDWLAFSGHAPGDANAGSGSGFSPGPGGAPDWSYAVMREGRYIGVGRGANATLSFNDARWGARNGFSGTNATPAAALMGTVDGASFMNYGADIGTASRLAVGFVATAEDNLPQAQGFSTPMARGATVAYTARVTRSVQLSATASYLDEKNLLLGSASSGYLSLGPEAASTSFGAGANVELAPRLHLGLDATLAESNPAGSAGSLITGVSKLTSTSFGAALTADDLTGARDALSFSVVKPLRVVSGSASLAVATGADPVTGAPVITNTRVGLAPGGSETDFGMSYKRPLDDRMTLGLDMAYRSDADNIAGERDAAGMLKIGMAF